MPFMALGLNSCFIPLLQNQGITAPTAIQKKVIPSILAGKDILACAQTGTGKTASFLLPLIDILAVSRARARIPRALIISPTRELALQTAEQAKIFSSGRNLQVVTLIGGTVLKNQLEALKTGADIVIATPGRLSDTIERGQVIMRGVSIAVIDEADRMLDMGFIPAIESIFAKIPRIRQTLMFSATLPSEARKLASKFLTNPKEVTIKLDKEAVNLVDQAFIISSAVNKQKILIALLNDDPPEKGIIFCNRKTTVDKLYRFLNKNKFRTLRMHGDLTQENRQASLAALKKERKIILVCSNVAARGLDVQDLSHVYNYDFPDSIDDYVHRIGRTGRAGKSGKALTFISSDLEKNLSDLKKNISLSKASVITYKNNQIKFINDDKNLTLLETEIKNFNSIDDYASTDKVRQSKTNLKRGSSNSSYKYSNNHDASDAYVPSQRKRFTNSDKSKRSRELNPKTHSSSFPDFITQPVKNKKSMVVNKSKLKTPSASDSKHKKHSNTGKKNYFDESNLPSFLKS